MKKDKRETWRNLTLVTEVGITVMVPTVLLTVLGVYLDGKFGTGFIAVILLILGIAGGFTGAYKLLKNAIPKKDKKEPEYDLMAEWKKDSEEKNDTERKG